MKQSQSPKALPPTLSFRFPNSLPNWWLKNLYRKDFKAIYLWALPAEFTTRQPSITACNTTTQVFHQQIYEAGKIAIADEF